MKTFYILLLIIISVTNLQAQKKIKTAKDWDKAIDESNKAFFCNLNNAFNSIITLKTDADLKDYFNFKFCNGNGKKIIGVVFGEKQGYGYGEIGRSKVSVLPNKTGNARLYLNYNISKYNINNYKIIKIIYYDGSSDERNY